ncbi:MAG: MoaD/ThiS family protein [Chloroflexi bacterium]|nr:MoaD/ThiS family protein [Chloroflexota bacterium]
MSTVYVPAPLRRLTKGQAKVETSGATVIQLIENLEVAYPGVKARICEENGDIKRFVNVFVNGEEIRNLQGKETEVKDSDEVSIIPAMAGGHA